MSETKTYTAADIEGYHSGQLSAAERHALEKAALDDPFLADALEGYAVAQTPAVDLASLQSRLQNRIQEKKKRRGLFYIGNNWMAVVALFVLIAVAGWLMFQSPNKEESLASATAKQTQKNLPPASLERAADSTSVVYNEAPKPSQPVIESESRQVETKATLKQATPAGAYKVPPAVFASPVDSTTKDYAARDMMNTGEDGRKREAFAEKAAAPTLQRQQEAKTDTIKNFNVTLKPNNEGLSEVVVVKPKATGNAQARKMQLVVDTLEPAEGWTDFNDYIANNLKEPDDLKTKSIKGEVELSFEVNKEGEPVNITVTKSLCEQCDEEAKRLLKEGPKWKKGKKKGKVKIKF